MSDELLAGYSDMLAKLKRPDQWDVRGLIDDVCDRLRADDNGEALAVILHLLPYWTDVEEDW